MTAYIIEAKNICYNYPDGTPALKNISLGIPRGKKVALLGANGAGKSTLFLHFNGIFKPSRGQISFGGQEIGYRHRELMELRKKVGIVFQDPDTQLFSASVMQEISFGPMNMGLTEKEVLERVEGALAATSIEDIKKRPTQFLSYGQKKRVSIADILAMDPEVIIFDEPTAWLDPMVSRQIMGLFDELNKSGKTVVLSTHDVNDAYAWADYVFIMKDGALAGEGLPGDIFSNRQLLAGTGLETPWLLDVYGALTSRGWLNKNGAAPRTKEELIGLLAEEKRDVPGVGNL